jgi:hypothetical protein
VRAWRAGDRVQHHRVYRIDPGAWDAFQVAALAVGLQARITEDHKTWLAVAAIN